MSAVWTKYSRKALQTLRAQYNNGFGELLGVRLAQLLCRDEEDDDTRDRVASHRFSWCRLGLG